MKIRHNKSVKIIHVGRWQHHCATIPLRFIFALFISFAGCVLADMPVNDNNESLIDALIIGSTQSPDPVLERVMELERHGIVKNVIVLESFPVQIHLKATKEIIEELNSIPRIK